MSVGFENIKRIYEDIIDYKECEELDFSSEEIALEDYVEKTYKEAKERVENLTDYNWIKKACELLNISDYDFDDLMIETININLYCELVLILQNIKRYSGIRKEIVLSDICSSFSSEDAKVIDDAKNRHRRRVRPDRINAMDEICRREIQNETFAYYVPVMLKAYREICFIKRKGTNIYDVSKYFTNIFQYLTFETDKEDEKTRKNICTFRIWDFSDKEISKLFELYRAINENRHDVDNFSEMMFSEKLLGILTLSRLLEANKECDRESMRRLIESIVPINCFGFCELAKKVMDAINCENYVYIDIVTKKVLYKIYSCTYKKVLNAIIANIEKDEERMCKKITGWINYYRNEYGELMELPDLDVLKRIKPEELVEPIKILMGAYFKPTKDNISQYISLNYDYEPTIRADYKSKLSSASNYFFDFTPNYIGFCDDSEEFKRFHFIVFALSYIDIMLPGENENSRRLLLANQRYKDADLDCYETKYDRICY